MTESRAPAPRAPSPSRRPHVLRPNRSAGARGAGAATRPAASPRARRVARELGVDWTQVPAAAAPAGSAKRDVRAAASAQKTVPPGGGHRRQPDPPDHRRAHDGQPPRHRARDAHHHGRRDQPRQPPRPVQGGAAGRSCPATPTSSSSSPPPPCKSIRCSTPAGRTRRSSSPRQCTSAIAVDTEAGLFVPVVRDVASLSLRQLAARTRDLAERARRGTLRVGGDAGRHLHRSPTWAPSASRRSRRSSTIPQCAILGVGRIQRRPVVVGDQIVVRDQITLSLTFDHRIVDGAPAARFLQTLSQLVENPGPWLMP